MKKILLGVFLGVLISGTASLLYPKNHSLSNKATPDHFNAINRQRASGDFKGDGKFEEILAFTKDDFFDNTASFLGFMAAYDESGKEIARTPQSFTPIYSTLPENMTTYKLDQSSKKDYLRLRIVAGAHEFNDLFLTLVGDQILPVCRVKQPTSINDCIFYNSSIDSVLVRDINKDGKMEITEIVDEYPPTGGRGRPVLAAVYSFDSDYFVPQENDSYTILYNLLKKEFKPNFNLMSKYDWSQESRKNFEAVKNFWEHK